MSDLIFSFCPPRSLRRALLSSLALGLLLVPGAELTAQPSAGDGSSAARPGVLQRPSAPSAPDREADRDEDDEEEEDDAAGSAAPARPGATNPSRPGAGRPAQQATPPGRRAPEPQRGPRVLNPEDIEPDIGDIDDNFEEDFDPLNLPSNVQVNIDFREAELNDVVMWISALTGRNFIIADTINASKKITIISPQPVSVSEAYRAFIAALSMNGLTVVPFGRFLRIVEASGAERQVLEPSDTRSEIPPDDRMVTHIHQLQHVSISTVQPVIDALKTEASSIVAYEPTNTMIITETGLNLRRILGIVEMLDVPGGQEQIFMYQAQYASADDLKSLIEQIFENDEEQAAPQQASSRRPQRRSSRARDEEPASESGDTTSVASVTVSQIIADERTNQLIIRANQRSYDRILEIMGQLDVPIPGEGRIHVLFLENAEATELASTLQSLTQSVQEQREQSGNLRAAEADSEPASGAEGAITASFSGEISITADEATNSLVVVASLRDFLALQNVVDQLDRRRQQVYVEAVIMEVSLNRSNSFGLSVTGGFDPGLGGEVTPLFGTTALGGLTSFGLPDPTSVQGLGVGLIGPTLDIGGASISAAGLLLQASQTDNDVNVLSTPHILTMDNEEAEIVVGENIPFISGVQGGLGSLGSLASLAGSSGVNTSALGSLGGLGSLGSLGGFASVQREDVALSLRITPQINESNFVRLEIEQEVEDVQSIDPQLGPRTTTRQINTTVVVSDQETVVLGGLMRDQQVEDVNKVPVLGDIPIIGRLFRQTTTRDVKTNLLLMLTPYIIRDSADFQEIFRRKMEEREAYLQYFGRRDIEYVQSVDYGRKDGPMQLLYERIGAAVEREEQRRRAFIETTEETPSPQPSMDGPAVDFSGEDDAATSGDDGAAEAGDDESAASSSAPTPDTGILP